MIHPKEPARLLLAMLPTPLVELKNLAKSLGVPRLLMKRDDLTGLELSGNKIRKLEYLLADAVAKGCDTLITHGGYQSNHCRATAAAGARMGMKVRLILRAPNGDPGNDGNLFLDRLLGAQISFHSAADYNARIKDLIAAAMAEERAAGTNPYFFPVGASVPLGCWGYVRMMAELADQLGRDEKVDVFAAVSSSGTFAGMVLGKTLLGLRNWRIAGIPVSDSLDYFRDEVRELIASTSVTFPLGLTPDQTPIDLIDGYIGDGYAIPTPAALETLKQLGRLEGILLDPTYTAKAMVGFLDQLKSNSIRAGALPVFVHTGGIFGLLARRDLF